MQYPEAAHMNAQDNKTLDEKVSYKSPATDPWPDANNAGNVSRLDVICTFDRVLFVLLQVCIIYNLYPIDS